MISVFTKSGFTDTWRAYLHEWDGAVANDFTVGTYDELSDLRGLPAGPIIFGDTERLTDTDRALASAVHRVVSDARPDIAILNNPSRTLRRYDLLTELHEREFNSFRVHRLTDTISSDRFPVFLRYENDHTGPTTGLLDSQTELNRAIVRAKLRMHDLGELLIVEFVDTIRDDGRYMKFGAFVVGETIVGRHAHSGTDWALKFGGSLTDPGSVATELEYVRQNPHVAALRERFDVGKVGYGRIDYAMLDGKVVTWEINTNPIIMSDRADTHPTSIPRQELFLTRFNLAFRTLHHAPHDPAPISLEGVPEEVRTNARAQPQARASKPQRFLRRHKGLLEPLGRVVESAAIPFEGRILEGWSKRNGIEG